MLFPIGCSIWVVVYGMLFDKCSLCSCCIWIEVYVVVVYCICYVFYVDVAYLMLSIYCCLWGCCLIYVVYVDDVYGLLSMGCCLWVVVYGLLSMVCCLLYVSCCLFPVICCFLFPLSCSQNYVSS